MSKKKKDETKRKELTDLDLVMGMLLDLGFLQKTCCNPLFGPHPFSRGPNSFQENAGAVQFTNPYL
jgi:hypothetical protein